MSLKIIKNIIFNAYKVGTKQLQWKHESVLECVSRNASKDELQIHVSNFSLQHITEKKMPQYRKIGPVTYK